MARIDVSVRNRVLFAAFITALTGIVMQYGVIFPYIDLWAHSKYEPTVSECSYLRLPSALLSVFFTLVSTLCFVISSLLFGVEYKHIRPVHKSRFALTTVLMLFLLGLLVMAELVYLIYTIIWATRL